MNRFDRLAQEWDSKPQRVKTAMAVADFITSQIKLDEIKMLDYGCGTGLLSFGICEDLKDKKKSVDGLDASNAMIDVFKDKAERIGYHFNGVNHTFGESDIPKNGYNLTVSSMTMHHIKDYKEFIKQMAEATSEYMAIADIESEDGSFHSDNFGVEHFGFDKEEIVKECMNYFEDVNIKRVQTMTKDGKEYHIFTVLCKK